MTEGMSHEEDAPEKENLHAGRHHTWRVKRVSTLIRLAFTYYQVILHVLTDSTELLTGSQRLH